MKIFKHKEFLTLNDDGYIINYDRTEKTETGGYALFYRGTYFGRVKARFAAKFESLGGVSL